MTGQVELEHLAEALASSGLRPYLRQEADVYYQRARRMETYLENRNVSRQRPQSYLAYLHGRYRATENYALSAVGMLEDEAALDAADYLEILKGTGADFYDGKPENRRQAYAMLKGMVVRAREACLNDQPMLSL